MKKIYFSAILFLWIISASLLVCIHSMTVNHRAKMVKLQLDCDYEKNINSCRLNRLEEVTLNLDRIYGVGASMRSVIADMKARKYEEIDGRIESIPKNTFEINLEREIEYHGLKKYNLSYPEFGWPVSRERSYIPAKWGEFGWRPELFPKVEMLNTDNTNDIEKKIEKKKQKWTFHSGSDFCNAEDPRIVSIADGKVVGVGFDSEGGNYIKIDTERNNKYYRAYYGHLRFVYVEKGQKVKRGELIGAIGKTGEHCKGAHLHFGFYEYDRDKKRWVVLNFLLNSTHKNKWIQGYYRTKKGRRMLL